MTVLNSGISWCTGTLNLTVGCTKVSAACDHCYAETLVKRGIVGDKDFERVRFYPQRLRDLRRFRPGRNTAGELEPKMIFVNSLSDFWHEQIPDAFIHQCLDAFEEWPTVIMQILTKRPVRMRKMIAERYGNAGVPANLWLGVSAEDNRVAARLNILRRLKDQAGLFTAFVSVEPIVAPCDKLSFEGIDWVLTGGESGPKARPMKFEWLQQAHDIAFEAGVPLHFKQYGHPRNNPEVVRLAARYSCTITDAWRNATENGFEKAPDEKGGATYKGEVYRQKPAHWHALKAQLNQETLKV